MSLTTPPDRHEIVRRAHHDAVLNAVLTAGPISRSGIGELTGLSKPVVLAVVAELSTNALILCDGQAEGRVGRAPELYVVNPRAGFIVGLDLGGTKLRAAIADLDGGVLRELVEPTDPNGGELVADQIRDLVRRLARASRIPLKRISAIAIGSPGVADQHGRMQLAVNLSGLSEISLTDHILRAFPNTVVVVENDVNIAAIGERYEGSGVGCDNLVVLSIGTGIGAGLIVGGRLLRGHHGAAGEVAWLTIGADPATHEARTKGALEVAAAGEGIRRMLRHAVRSRPTGAKLVDASVAEIFAAAVTGDRDAQEVVRAEAELVACAVMSIVSVVDPEMVVLAGGIGSNPDLLPRVRAYLERLSPFPIRVESSKLGERSGVVGALALARGIARNAHFGEPTDANR